VLFSVAKNLTSYYKDVCRTTNVDGQRCGSSHLPALNFYYINYKSLPRTCQPSRLNDNSLELSFLTGENLSRSGEVPRDASSPKLLTQFYPLFSPRQAKKPPPKIAQLFVAQRRSQNVFIWDPVFQFQNPSFSKSSLKNHDS